MPGAMERAGGPLIKRLARGPMLCDGSMLRLREIGPQRGLTDAEARHTAALNLEHPAVVQSVHEEYLAAGCDAILTNTFQVSPHHMQEVQRNPRQHRTEDMVRTAAEIAQCAATAAVAQSPKHLPKKRWVLGDIGVLRAQALGHVSRSTVAVFYREHVSMLREAGVDGIIVEYVANADEMQLAVQACKAAVGQSCPVLVTPIFGKTPAGEYRTPLAGSECLGRRSRLRWFEARQWKRWSLLYSRPAPI